MRKTLEDTWRYLEARGEGPPRRADGGPLVADAMPSHDDDVLRVSFFRTWREDDDYGDLALPRTFMGRSEFTWVRFVNTDLSESRMCWNNFTACNFSGADLSGCDMRASRFIGCRFAGATLRGADLRHSSFKDCDFAGADLAGAVAEDEDAIGRVQDWLSGEQQAVMAWAPDEGPEPPGG